MLERLDAVNWHELEHAYGKADDVPDLLRNLASSNAQTRQNALSELYSNIYHQGTVFEATVYAVPFLLELSQTETVKDRDLILIYLAHLASGHSYLEVHQDALFYAEELHNSEFPTQIQQEMTWVRNVKLAVCNDPNIYLNLLGHSEPHLRAAAPYTLASCQQCSSEIVARLKKCLSQESHPQVKASLIFSLGVLEPPESASLQLFVNFLNSEDDLVQLAAAMTLARLAKDKTPPKAVAILIGAIQNSASIRALTDRFPWFNCDVVSDASNFLSYLGTAGSFAIPALISALETVDSYSVLSIVRSLLYLAFYGQKSAVTTQNITAEQRSVLEAIASCSNVWQFNTNMANILKAFGLPEQRNQLQLFLING
jgi:HEAT repeat protein